MNRPTIGYSPCPVDRGTAVFELGYQNMLSADGAMRSQIGQGFLRFGVAQHWEFDVIGPNEIVAHMPGTAAAGLSDYGAGFKYGLLQSQRWQLGFDGLFTPPDGARAFTTGSATLVANFDASYQLTPTTSFASTLSLGSGGGYAKSGAHAAYGTFQPSVLVLQQFDRLTQAYVEYVNVSRSAPDAGDSSFMDTGIQRLVCDDLEVDVEYGHALTGLASQRFTYVGAGFGVLLR